MESNHSQRTLQRPIKQLIEEMVAAIQTKDVEALMQHYAPEVVLFDVVAELSHTGAEAVRTRMQQWFATLQEPVGFEIAQLHVEVAQTLAFAHRLNHVSAALHAGGTLDMWWRETTCCREIDGRWLITHQHSSVPFNIETGQGAIDLKPKQ